MPSTYKVLGQAAPNANTTSNVYTVPAATQAVISTIIITNRNSAANATYRLAVQPAGVTALDSVSLQLGLSLGNTDVLSVSSANANISFSVFGVEIT
jgi:hypothetical protein